MRLLVVEDNRDILANLADYLALKGYEVDCAQDGLTGLHLAATQHYDLIVLDIMLPGMDGCALCQRLREGERRDTPVIMLTARDALDDRLSGFRAGADDYLTKPFALPELAARIEAVLKRSRAGGGLSLTEAVRRLPGSRLGRLPVVWVDRTPGVLLVFSSIGGWPSLHHALAS